jgi:predicted phosphohydrolase
MKAHVLSDIHLEKDPPNDQKKLDIRNYFTSNEPTVLFLLGDIGNVFTERYKTFMRSCSKNYEHVFIILGNHEFYGNTIDDTISYMREFCKSYPNIHFLNEDVYDFEELGIRIVGTTLWSHVTEEQMSDIRCFIADYRLIQNWSVQNNNAQHQSALEWIKNEIQRSQRDGKKLIIMTHHAPLLKSCHPKQYDSPLSSAFETDLSNLISTNNHIVLWMYGHSHFSDKRTLMNTLVMSNQYGYGGEMDAHKRFDENAVIDLCAL